MPDGILSFEHGEIRLGSVLLPGTLKSLSVRGQVRFDEAEPSSGSGKVKMPMGWEDSDITLTVELITGPSFEDDKDTTTCYDKLAELDSSFFKDTDDGENPIVYTVFNEHLFARDIQKVVFNGLESSETDEDDVILAILSFVEHIPVITIAEERMTASDKAKGETTPSTTTKEPEADPAIVKDQSPWDAGYGLGVGS